MPCGSQADEVGLPWDMVQAADAAQPGSRDAAGLAALVERSLPAVDATRSTRPPRARPRAPARSCSPRSRRSPGTATSTMLSRWTDLGIRRPQAIWVLVPQLSGSQGAIIDKRPLPLAAPGQYFRLDAEWIDSTHAVVRPRFRCEGTS